MGKIMMTATERRDEAAGRVRAAEDAVARLRAGLAEAGVKLPSLRVDPVSCAAREPLPLVDLGRCTVDTVLRLCAVIEERHDATPAPEPTAVRETTVPGARKAAGGGGRS
ncbi:hypothetical protein [Streptomyces nitrosporeus]|uniref:hypothetical protein n=1 Tax=Streptomyces nitrosporeus TaxID=28894 RepID=UPI001E63E72B|nr:hypothetical protein [Streptomyces nitrosporeus]